MAKWIEDSIMFATEVNVGDIVSSSHFKNLLYRDLGLMDPLEGFYVNPRIVSRNTSNITFTTLESIPIIARKTGGKKHNVSFHFELPGEPRFVVVYTEGDCNHVREYDSTEDRIGHYPLVVKARLLGPMDLWDPNGIVITFYMRSAVVRHCVPEVELRGFMAITYNTVVS